MLFQDLTFTVSTKRVVSFCLQMNQADLNFAWTYNIELKPLNEKRKKAAGCHIDLVSMERGEEAIHRKYYIRLSAAALREKIYLIKR